MNIISNLVSVKDDRWCWPNYDKESYQIQISDTSLFDKIKPYLRGKNVMIQAGGNCGVMLENFVLNFKTVYSFEPDPLNFYCLTNNLPYTNLIKVQGCLGNQHQMISLNNGLTTNMQDVGAVHINQTNTGTVPTFKIDDFNLPSCDLIQVDIEGFEYYALLGGINTIEKYFPVICTEMNPHWAKRYGVSLSQVEDLLVTKLGYTFAESHMDDKIYYKK